MDYTFLYIIYSTCPPRGSSRPRSGRCPGPGRTPAWREQRGTSCQQSGECGQPDRETTFIGAQYLLIGRLVRNVVTKYNLKEADNKKISSLPAKTF